MDSGVRPTTLSHCDKDGHCLISKGKDSSMSFDLVTSCFEYNFISFPCIRQITFFLICVKYHLNLLNFKLK